jgi:hypothetical protein
MSWALQPKDSLVGCVGQTEHDVCRFSFNDGQLQDTIDSSSYDGHFCTQGMQLEIDSFGQDGH